MANAPWSAEKRQRAEESAKVAYESGHYDEALDLLEALTNLPDVDPVLIFNLGLTQNALGDYEAAAESFGRLVDSVPEARALRALNLDLAGETERARADYLEVLHVAPNDVDTLVNIGTMEMANNHVDDAERYLGRAAEIDPRCNWQYADVLIARAKYADAQRAMEIALNLGENRAHLDLALLAARLGDQSAAVRHFRLAIEAGASLARREFATYLLERSEDKLAMQIALEGARLGDTWSYAPLSVAYRRLGMIGDAERYHKLALDEGDDEFLDSHPR